MEKFRIEERHRVLVNTDPQRRCYNGCYFSSEWQWSAWDWIALNVKPENVERKLTFWRDLTAYAVKARGKSAETEYRAVCERVEL